MWIVRIALTRPYTFIVLAILILFLSPLVILRMPADIFPGVDIPVIAIAWQYSGLNAPELQGRLTTPFEKSVSSLVDNVEHIEATTYDGVAIVKIFLQPHSSVDTANAQVTAVSQFVLKQLPTGTLPPEITDFSASSVPVVQLAVSGIGLSEQQLNDYAQNFVRPQLATVRGAQMPLPYGGKESAIMVSLNPNLMQAKGIAPEDILNALNEQNLVLPSGSAKIGETEYDVRLNGAPQTIDEISNFPIRQVGNSTIYLRDVATVSNGFQVQTNVVREDGRRAVLINVLKTGNASTLDVVNGVLSRLPRVATMVPPNLKVVPLLDQSIFVRGAIDGVVRESILAAGLTGLMILIFLGSWRSTLIIAISIPLSILTSILLLSVLHQTINIMTLGGLALAVGILVDDATVTIENIERYIEQGHPLDESIFRGAAQIAVPALVSTLSICVVFLPMFLLTGVARYLFIPLAEAVVFAMLASYLFSRTLVPTLAMYMLRVHDRLAQPRNILGRFQRSFESGFDRMRNSYKVLLTWLVARRMLFIPVFMVACACAFLLIPWLGQDFFPNTDSGEFILHLRGKTDMRIEETARLCDLVEDAVRREVPPQELDHILDNIGLPYSPLNTTHMNSGTVGSSDADIMVSLNQHHHPTADYIRELRQQLPREFPGTTFYFLPADIVTQILNFGLPAPIDVQIEGDDVETSHRIAVHMLDQMRAIPGLADLRVQQPMDHATLDVDVNRTKAEQGGYTERDVSTSVLNSLSGSGQITPMYFLDPQNDVEYSLIVQMPQYRIQSLEDLRNLPISSSSTPGRSEILGDVASIHRSDEMQSISEYDIRRVIDIYGSVQDRALGAVARDVNRVVAQNEKSLPRGTYITVRGQVQTMRNAYQELLTGIGFAVVLVYMLIVVNFQSWLDPFIIITALPAALAGIVLFLFITHTTLSVPALMGAIMCMGVGTANSILVVSFANERLREHGDAVHAAIEAGVTRLRPVLMTALAMIIGMIPMAFGMGDGGEQNAPLGRAVIGGLLCATVATLVFVPAVFALLHGGHSRRRAKPFSIEEDRAVHA